MLENINSKACDFYQKKQYLEALWVFETLEAQYLEMSSSDECLSRLRDEINASGLRRQKQAKFQCKENAARSLYNQAACLYQLGASECARLRSKKATLDYEQLYGESPMTEDLWSYLYPPLWDQIDGLSEGRPLRCRIMPKNL